ncbi:putative echinoidin isoform X1 [Apostichopus japonicus]|uniref:Putative echinoidin isoform X1 n=1 Tax=Stichopus japonicus TaxID=307972 RepID=A0A2G8LNX2_STIJA|nr:putative echinoidin isoform X1 [Apostichopus japonicus]
MKLWWLAITCLYLNGLIKAIPLSNEGSLSSRCVPGWTFWGSHCYRFFSNHQMEWFDAERFCNQFGTIYEGAEDQLAHLVSIHSELENMFVRSLWEGVSETIHGHRRNCWIGLNDVRKEGDFVWSDRTTYDYFRWKIQQPNNKGGHQNCVALSDADSGTFMGGSWDDGRCTLVLPFMCKMLPVYIAPPR